MNISPFPVVAYFSMEIAISDQIPNFHGGLGILAGDILLSASDREDPIVGVSLVYNNAKNGEKFPKEKFFQKLPQKISVVLDGKLLMLSAYTTDIVGNEGKKLPVIFLSTDEPENSAAQRAITDDLYSNNWETRLLQEAILGIGGVKMLDALGFSIKKYHMNEGHAASLVLELLKKYDGDEEMVKKHCTFTTHTPVEAGHDYFEYGMAQKILGDFLPLNITDFSPENALGMTELSLSFSSLSNSVSEKHKTVCEEMFPKFSFQNVTNGIYHPRWVSPAFENLFDQFLPGWKTFPGKLYDAQKSLPEKSVLKAKQKEKKKLIDWVNAHHEFFPFSGVCENDFLQEDVLTIAFARRCVPYKRHDLILQNLEKLLKIGENKIQIIFAAKWYANDPYSEKIKKKIEDAAKKLRGKIKIILVPEYNMEVAKKLLFGSDIWLNTPIPPKEASGTSGMKAALNGGLNLSVLDGWWLEGMEKNFEAGWGFGELSDKISEEFRDEIDSDDLYEHLHYAMDFYYYHEELWEEYMKNAISLLSQFNTHRVCWEYFEKMWK